MTAGDARVALGGAYTAIDRIQKSFLYTSDIWRSATKRHHPRQKKRRALSHKRLKAKIPMTPEATLFLDAVDIHRALIPLLARVPSGRRLAREAYGNRTDIEAVAERFAEAAHPDVDAMAAALLFAWAPAEARP